MIQFDSITFIKDKKKILDDVSLVIPNGKICVFMGENGSGKTTLFETLLPYNKKRVGKIYVDDILIEQIKDKELAKKIAFNFQLKPVTDSYVIDMLSLARSPYKGIFEGLNEEDNRIMKDAIDKTNIEDFLYQKMDSLSGGERQMVYMAMSMIQDASYFVFDEPDTYLDIPNKKRIYQILKKLRDDGKTILVSLHTLEDAFSLADILYIIEDGRLKGTILKEDFDNENLIEKTFSVKKIKMEIDGEISYIFK